MTQTAEPFLKARNIVKSYGGVRALDDVSIDIFEGEFLTLLGPSGSGKTTFLMCLAGFVEPTAGQLYQRGEDIARRPAEERRFGMVFQGYALFPHMTIARNVDFPLLVQGVGRAERAERVARILETVGLAGYGGRMPDELSGGQQQRVALARALVSGPKVILLDEPLSALDKNLRVQMQEEIKTLHSKAKSTFVFVTHDQTEALSMSSRIAIFNQGCLQQIGMPRDVYERPANRFVAEFLGRINLLPLESASQANGRVTGLFEGRQMSAEASSLGLENPVIAVRPEHMRVEAGEPGAECNALRATITDYSYGGAHSVLQLQTASGHLVTLDIGGADTSMPVTLGETVWVSWPRETGFVMSGA